MIRRPARGLALAVLASAAALLLTGCGSNADPAPDRAAQTQTADGADEAQTKEMQRMLDGANEAADQADSDATQNN
ncbi:hypothetical protein ACFXB3_25240 [Streptomyces sp. NPDC059447]|uniref:hypothetical protein n=1 Tax=Streptomyces sp. NPDC059447 TaxID=3346834 RepID=UPI00367A284C